MEVGGGKNHHIFRVIFRAKYGNLAKYGVHNFGTLTVIIFLWFLIRSCEVNQLDDRLKKLNMLKKEAKLLIDNIEHGQHQHYLPS